jgi:exopolysaccharide biosynthesis polyprenyl glycosylphosphotransferase
MSVVDVTRPLDAATDAPPRLERALGRERLISRRLLVADATALVAALLIVETLGGETMGAGRGRLALVSLFFVAVCLAGARLCGLHRGESVRVGHSTADEIGAVVVLVASAEWVFIVAVGLVQLPALRPSTLILLWTLAVLLVLVLRASVRARYRQDPAFLENTVIVGAGNVGQLIARKLLHHPEYGLRLIGLVDDRPRRRRPDLENLTLLGGVEELDSVLAIHEVKRVIVAFSNEAEEQTLEMLRRLSSRGIRVGIVPRLFEAVTPHTALDSVEGLPLLSLPANRPSRTYALAKRALDVVGALTGLILIAPVFVFIAWRIRRDSSGPVLFRQTRYGMDMREFTSLKFRTMKANTPSDRHREYIRTSMNGSVRPESNGLFKLDRADAVTQVGRWLRKTSLDELPQLINVLRGDISLVGPRPCIPYEVESFAPHHYERFLVPQGLTGLWQVTARAHSTFHEALDMDVAYARACSFGLDLRLIIKTPLQMLASAVTR